LPFFISFALFDLYPTLFSLYISFTKWDGLYPPVFIGLANYTRILHDEVFLIAIYNTFIIGVLSIIPQLFLGLILAAILNDKLLKGKDFFRAIFFVPYIVTASFIGLLAHLLFDWQSGSINMFLVQSGFISEPINWLNDPATARLLNVVVSSWNYFGYYMIILIAGMQGINPEISEAAQVDGASKVQVFWKITLPLLRPVMLFLVVTSLIFGMQVFDIPYVLTDGVGGPEKSTLTLVMLLYRTAFKANDFGYGATIAYSLFVLIFIFSLLSLKIMNRKEA
jgi:multiple sugar transport system permease protein